MKKQTLSRIGGWALILAGLRFFLFIMPLYLMPNGYGSLFQGSKILTAAQGVFVFLLGPLFMLFGLLGLRARYGEVIGKFGRIILLVGAIGDPLLVYGGALINLGIALYITFLSLAIGQICLAIFGILALKYKPLPRMNWLPLAAGAWYPIAYPIYLFVLTKYFFHYSELTLTPAEVVDIIIASGIFLQAIAMMALGWIVTRDMRKSPPISP